MATMSVVAQGVAAVQISSPCSPVFQSSSSTRLKIAASGAAARNDGELTVRASSSEERCSRREAMTIAGGAGLAGLLLLLPVTSAEARTTNPGVRKQLKLAIDKLKAEAEKTTKVAQRNVKAAAEKATKVAQGNVKAAPAPKEVIKKVVRK